MYILVQTALQKEIAIYTALFKKFRDVFSWSYEEMPTIDPSIVEHEIRTYLDAKPVQKKLDLSIHVKKWLLRLKLKNY